MNREDAENILLLHAKTPKSEVAQAISALLKIYKRYSAIPIPGGLSEHRLRAIHKTAALPRGVQWKLDTDAISLAQAVEIAKLSSASDQWLLAIFAIKEKLPATECKILANAVEKEGESLTSALRRVSAIHVETAAPAMIPLPLPIDDYIHFAKAAWDREMSIADLCYEAAKKLADIHPDNVADELESLVDRLRAAGSPSNRAPLISDD